jgi:centromeric protein E
MLAYLQIMDEKSLIKKYQKEIQILKNELEQVKKGVAENPYFTDSHENLVSLKQQV